METIPPTTQDDGAGAPPSSVKSEDSSPRHGSGRGSPPPNCAICLGICRNKSFTDSCLHQFCFKCLLTWSKVKAECPLCKQNFRSIIHNVQSNHQYEEYMVEQRHEEAVDRIDIDTLATAARRFRYRTTLTLPRRESLAIQQLLLHYPLVADVLPRASPRLRSSASFRRTVYRHDLWARPLPDFTGRFRDCSPEFYRYNDSQMHRLVPWLNRELSYLLNDNVGHISYVMTRILELLPQYHINSSEFREALQRYFGDRTEHFLHELNCFASTPYDLTGYDRNVQYTTDSRVADVVNEISSSESESVDSDIVMVSSSEPAEPPAGPSRPPPPVYPHHYIPPPPSAPHVIPIETISQSDSDDSSSEVMVVGYMKPPQERTPEVVDLVGSDSDVVLHEPEPRAPLVRLSLKRRPEPASPSSPASSHSPPSPLPDAALSDSDDSYRPPARSSAAPLPSARPPPPAVRAPPPTARTSPAFAPRPSNSPPPATASSSTMTYMPWDSPFSTTSTTSSSSSDSSNDACCSCSPDRKRSKAPRKKSKKKSKEATSSKDRKRSKKRTSRSLRKYKKSAPGTQVEKRKQSKHKSYSGKGVKKSSKRTETSTEPAPAESPPAAPAPGTCLAGPSGASGGHKRKPSKDSSSHRASQESKRLKSVVNVMFSHKSAGSSAASQPAAAGRRPRATDSDSTDSEDNLPLNLTVHKMK